MSQMLVMFTVHPFISYSVYLWKCVWKLDPIQADFGRDMIYGLCSWPHQITWQPSIWLILSSVKHRHWLNNRGFMFGKQLHDSISLEKAAHAGFLQSQGKSLGKNWQPTENSRFKHFALCADFFAIILTFSKNRGYFRLRMDSQAVIK